MFKKIGLAILFAGILPVSVFAAMPCASSGFCGNSCGCQSCGCQQGCSNGCKNSNALYRNFKKYDNINYQNASRVEKRSYAPVNDNVEKQPRYSVSRDKSGTNGGKSNMYLALGPSLYALSFTNEYASDYEGADLVFQKDEYSFEPLFGGYFAIGTKLDSGLRADLELGITSTFVDSEEIAKFKMSVPYGMANLYRDFDSGLYIGGGIGVARITESVGGTLFDNVTAKEVSWSPKVGVALGYSAKISDNMSFDLRYRLSGIKGGKLSHQFLWDQFSDGTYEQYTLRISGGIILENAVSAGIRFNF